MHRLFLTHFADYIPRVQGLQLFGVVNEVAGPCADDQGYQGNIVGIPTSFSSLNNNLTGSYCIGFIVDTASTNQGALAYFHEAGTTSIIGSINITSNSIVYTIRGTTVTYTFVLGDTSGYHHYQLCTDGSDLTLYENCAALAGSIRSFVHDGFSDDDIFSLLNDVNGAENIYMVIIPLHFYLSNLKLRLRHLPQM